MSDDNKSENFGAQLLETTFALVSMTSDRDAWEKRARDAEAAAVRLETWAGELQRQMASAKQRETELLAENARLRRGKR